MALTYATQTPHAAATLAVGAGTVPGSGGWLPVNYGASIVVEIANGATGPTVGAEAVVKVATDGAGANAREIARFPQGDLSANAVDRWLVGLAPGAGDGGDFPFYHVYFDAPTGNDVTAGATASSVTSY